ncbi:eIF3-S7 [Symbiodinium sp. KB8]|nr:eIF3-S7 [Symbiodinium sp. KB8]
MEPPLEPAWERLLVIRRLWRHDLIRIWREVIAEIRELMDDLADESTAWLAARSQNFNLMLNQKIRLVEAMISINDWCNACVMLTQLRRICRPCMNHYIRQALPRA